MMIFCVEDDQAIRDDIYSEFCRISCNGVCGREHVLFCFEKGEAGAYHA